MIGVHLAIGLALTLAMPPLLQGVIHRTKARLAGRRGAPLLQPWYDLLRLWRKDMVISETTTAVFRLAPLVTLAATLLAALILPLHPDVPAPFAFAGDAVLFAYLFALGRFFTTAAALDTGSPFEGMGAAREVTFACFAEPSVFLAFLCLCRLTGSTSLTGMLAREPAVIGAMAPLALVVSGLFIVMLAESSRVPFDDPNTHLELTMIHEVMVLDHSGPLLGAILYGAWLKLFVLAALIVRIVAPPAAPWAWWAIFVAAMVGLAIGVGLVESLMARLRLRGIPTLLVGAFLLVGFGYLLLVGA